MTSTKDYQIKPRIKNFHDLLGRRCVVFVAVGHPYHDALNMEGDWNTPVMSEFKQFYGMRTKDIDGLEKCNWLHVLVLTGLSKRKVHKLFKRYLRKQRARCKGKY